MSGAHFNPAVTLAVFIYERKKKYLRCFLMIITAQLVGSFIGVFIAYLLAKYHKVELYPDYYVLSDGHSLYFKDFDHNPYFGRLLLNEFLATFTFIFVLLIVKYKKSLAKVEEPIKGVAITLTLFCCYSMTAGAGACLNPWFGFTETMLYFG